MSDTRCGDPVAPKAAARTNKLTRKRRCPPMPSRYLYRRHVGLFGDRPPLRDTLTGGRPPGRKLPDPCWGGLAIIGGNEAKCRPSGFSSETRTTQGRIRTTKKLAAEGNSPLRFKAVESEITG